MALGSPITFLVNMDSYIDLDIYIYLLAEKWVSFFQNRAVFLLIFF